MSGYELLNTYDSDVTALTANTVDGSQSLTVRSADSGSQVRLLGAWRKGTVAAPFRIRSPRLHDDVQGIRVETVASGPYNVFDHGIQQSLVSNDKLTIESYDTDATNANVLALIGYDSIAGSNGNYATWSQIQSRIMALIGVSIDISAGGTLSEYSAGDSFDVSTNLMKAQSEYAILGYDVENTVAGIAVAGPCTGNLKNGGPGVNNLFHTRDWFVKMSVDTGLPFIPVMRQADIANTFAYQVDNAAGATNTVTFLCAQLSS